MSKVVVGIIESHGNACACNNVWLLKTTAKKKCQEEAYGTQFAWRLSGKLSHLIIRCNLNDFQHEH